MRFKTKRKRSLKANEICQAEQNKIRFVQKERFSNVSKPIENSKEISKNLNFQIVTLQRRGWNNLGKTPTNTFHSRLNAKHINLLTSKLRVVQFLLEKAHRDNLNEGPEYV